MRTQDNSETEEHRILSEPSTSQYQSIRVVEVLNIHARPNTMAAVSRGEKIV